MNSKFTIDSTTDGGGKLHEAIAGGCIVDVLVNGIPIDEADISRAPRVASPSRWAAAQRSNSNLR